MSSDILYLNNSGLSLYGREKKALQFKLTLKDPEQAVEILSQYLSENASKPVDILVDLLEESYVLESVPHLNGRDRDALIQRKKTQLFPGSRFVFHAVRGRDSAGRRDDWIFFSAIGDEHTIQPWLSVLLTLRWPISSIQSLPILSEKLVKDLAGGEHKFLLGLSEEGSGLTLRQNYFKAGVLALSRFRKINITDLPELAVILKDETDRSRRFILRQFNLSPDISIAVHIFYAGQEAYTYLKQVDFSTVNVVSYHYFVPEFAHSKGFTLPDHSGLNQLLAVQAAQMGKGGHYHSLQSRYYYRHHQLRQGLYLLSLLTVLGGLGYAGFSLVENADLDQTAEQLRLEQQDIAQRLAQLTESPLTAGFNPFEMRAKLNVYQQLQATLVAPDALLTPVSAVLQKNPNIFLKSISWGDTGEISQDSVSDLNLVDSAGGVQKVNVRLSAGISPFDGNYRKALALIDRLSRQFEQTQILTNIKAIKLPIEIGSNSDVSGNIGQRNPDSEFVLEMQWQHP